MAGNEDKVRVIRFSEGSKVHKVMIKAIVEEYIKQGYNVYTNYWMTIDGKRVKIDAVAEKDNKRIAIECYVQPQLKYIRNRINLLKKAFDTVVIVVPEKYDDFIIYENGVIVKYVDVDKMKLYEEPVDNERLKSLIEELRRYEAIIAEYEKRIKELEAELSRLKHYQKTYSEVYYLVLKEYTMVKKGKVAEFDLILPDGSEVTAFLFIDKRDNKLVIKYFDSTTKKWILIGEVAKEYINNKFTRYTVKISDPKFEPCKGQIEVVLEKLMNKIAKLEEEYGLIFDIIQLKTEFTTAYDILQNREQQPS